VELESVKKLAAKMQKDSEKMEREREAAGEWKVSGKDFSLWRKWRVCRTCTQEAWRRFVFNVKLRCRDRVDKLEDLWKEFQQQQ
jgi:hypothetical protein